MSRRLSSTRWSSRSACAGTGSSAWRRAAPCASARRRPRRPRRSWRVRRPLHDRAARRAAEAEEAPRTRRAGAALPPAQVVRGRAHLARGRRARRDEVENRILAARVPFQGEDLPLRSAQARLAVIDEYADREELGVATSRVSAGFNDDRLDLRARIEALDAEISGIATRSSATRRRRASRCASCRRRSPRRAGS